MNGRFFSRVWRAAIFAGAGAHAALGQAFHFAARVGENTVYCGSPGSGPLIDHRFQTPDPTDDTVSVSDPGSATQSPSSAQGHLDAVFSGSTLIIDATGAAARSGSAGGAYAVADSHDDWTLDLAVAACFRLSISLEFTSSDSPNPTQGFNLGVSSAGLIRLRDGTNTLILSHAMSAPGSWSAEFDGTLTPGQYFLTLFGRCDGNASPFNSSFRHTASLALVSCPCSADFDNDGDVGTDADIEAFFACLAGDCCATCGSADFNGDGDIGTDADIESFFRVLGGGSC